MYAFFAYENDNPGVVGIAFVGVVCFDAWESYKTSISEYFRNDLTTAKIFAHEIGHNLNMRHDFVSQPGNERYCSRTGESCTNIESVMDYNQVSENLKFKAT